MLRYLMLASALTALCLAAACGPGPRGTRSIEENFLGGGVSNQMITYGDKLYYEGRLPEAHAAYLQAENQAHTSTVRKKAATAASGWNSLSRPMKTASPRRFPNKSRKPWCLRMINPRLRSRLRPPPW